MQLLKSNYVYIIHLQDGNLLVFILNNISQNKECSSHYTKQVVIILIMIAEASLSIELTFGL